MRSDFPEKGRPEEGVGEYLRRQREGRQVSQERLSAVTKIKVKYLQAIEEGRFAELPPEPILRGFLRAYAAEVGLDASDVLRRYEASPGRRVTGPSLPQLRERVKTSPFPLRRAVVLGVWLFFSAGLTFLFTMGGWEKMVGGSTRRDAPKAVKEVATSGEVKEPVSEDNGSNHSLPHSEGTLALEKGAPRPSPAGPAEEPASVVPAPLKASTGGGPDRGASGGRLEVSVKKEDGGGSPPSPQEKGPLVLKITALEDTWLRVIIDDVKQDEVLLLEGRSRDWKAREKFVLTVGNRAGTQVELNGLAIQLPKTSSNVVRNFLISQKDLP